jgi:hypothetical protein
MDPLAVVNGLGCRWIEVIEEEEAYVKEIGFLHRDVAEPSGANDRQFKNR